MPSNSLITCNANLVSVDVASVDLEPFTLEFVTGDGIVAHIRAESDGERLSLDIQDGLVTQKARTGTRLCFQLPDDF
jgi:hypothetical protein